VEPERATLIVVCAEDAAQPLVEALRTRGVAAQASGRRNLDGAAIASWMVVAGVALKMAPDILRALGELVKQFRVARVEVNLETRSLVIDNPRAVNVDEMVRRFEAAAEELTGDESAAGESVAGDEQSADLRPDA